VGDAGALTVREATLVIRNQQGMHARACQVFVRTATWQARACIPC
jgi:phosphotransferase system HPr-like phosphotransfer protein